MPPIVSFFFAALLMCIALCTAVGQYKKYNMWPFIVCYWTVLAIKYFVEWVLLL